jgi:hypothetical protein
MADRATGSCSADRVLRGRVSNINRPSDIAGVYGAAGAVLAVGGARDRADKPERRGAGTVRPVGRPDSQCSGDYGEIAGRAAATQGKLEPDGRLASRGCCIHSKPTVLVAKSPAFYFVKLLFSL